MPKSFNLFDPGKFQKFKMATITVLSLQKNGMAFL